MLKDKKLTITLVIYSVAFYAVWAVRTLLLDLFKDMNPVAGEFLKEIIKFSVWFVPAWILIKKYNNFMYIKREEFFNFRIKWINILPVFLILTLFPLISSFRIKGSISISENFSMASVIIVLFVGITEEIVFRGWLLNSTYSEEKKVPAMALNAVMFLAIHFPIWIKNGVFASNITSGAFIQIIILSLLFGYIFTKTRSILPVIFLHMYWDLLVFMFQ